MPANSRASLVLDHGRTTNAYTVVETSGGAGATITLTYAEAAIDSAGRKGNRNDVAGRTIRGIHDVIQPGGGERRRFQTLYWRSGRYVKLDIETGAEPLRVHDVSGIFTAYPFVERGRFSSDLAWLSDVWRMNWNGARIGAFETYMDTPYYEQLQYIGDTRLQALISLYVAGDDRLVRQAIAHFDESRIPEGITASRYPSQLQQLIPPFSLIYVAMVHDYFMHRDDPAFVRQRLAGHPRHPRLVWPSRGRDAACSARCPTGTSSTGRSGGSAACRPAETMATRRRSASSTPTPSTAPPCSRASSACAVWRDAYRARADSLRRAVRARAWDPSRKLFRDAPDSAAFSQQTNVLAILADAVPAAEQRALMERVLADSTLIPASYYFDYYVFEALRKVGLGDRYIEQLAPWRGMLALGLTSAPGEAGADSLRHACLVGASRTTGCSRPCSACGRPRPAFAPC